MASSFRILIRTIRSPPTVLQQPLHGRHRTLQLLARYSSKTESDSGTSVASTESTAPDFTILPTAAEKLKPWEDLKTREFPPLHDRFEGGPQWALQRTLSAYLPPLYGGPQPRLEPGNHLVYFPPAYSEEHLLEDGTDDRHAPDRSWKYRVWAGGSVEFYPGSRLPLDGRQGTLQERIESVRTTGNPDKPDKIFVEIDRTVSMSRGSVLKEIRNLCFMQEIPPSLRAPQKTRTLRPPSDPTYQVVIKPSNALLFRFSALTFNAHAIHIDPQYTREVYGLRNLLVHGPLQLTLMLEVLRRELARRADAAMEIKRIDYKNLSPLFVDETFQVCCKRIRFSGEDGKTTTEDWQVWIQTGSGEDAALIAKGVVKCEDDPHMIEEKSAIRRNQDTPTGHIEEKVPIRHLKARKPSLQPSKGTPVRHVEGTTLAWRVPGMLQ